MGREKSAERRRRSRSRSSDRYGRDKTNDDRHKIHAYGRDRDRDRERKHRDSRRLQEEEREGSRRDRERDSRYEDTERGRHRGRDDRDGERSRERRDHRGAAERPRMDAEGHSAHNRSSTEKRPSRWGNADPIGIVGNGAHMHGGMYGPADNGRPSGGGRGGGGGGRGQAAPRDESWVEHRLKLRADARPPRGVWNRSPSPPKKKEPKVTKPPSLENTRKTQTKDRGARSGNMKAARRASGAKVVQNKDAKRKPRRKRAPSLSSSASGTSSSSSSGSDSDSGSDSSSSSSSSSSNSDSDSGNSDTGSSTSFTSEKERSKRLTGGKRKRRPASGDTEEHDKLKGARPGSPLPSSQPVAQVDAAGMHDGKKATDGIELPPEELDELDAAEAAQFKADVQGHRHHETKDSDDEAGPMPVPQLDDLQGEGERGVNYGGALLPGEGAAIAQFVQKGLRIPRRGEVGWAGQEIERLEDSGYVMSGSRHARMNAVRLRKENQVFNAEERRALALIMFEEKQQKENEILGNFRQMLTESTREGEKTGGEDANKS